MITSCKTYDPPFNMSYRHSIIQKVLRAIIHRKIYVDSSRLNRLQGCMWIFEMHVEGMFTLTLITRGTRYCSHKENENRLHIFDINEIDSKVEWIINTIHQRALNMSKELNSLASRSVVDTHVSPYLKRFTSVINNLGLNLLMNPRIEIKEELYKISINNVSRHFCFDYNITNNTSFCRLTDTWDYNNREIASIHLNYPEQYAKFLEKNIPWLTFSSEKFYENLE